MRRLMDRLAFIAASVVVMVALHGNSRQWWPKVPYLSLRDESVGEHTRLLFNTLAVVTVAQAALGRLPAERRAPRAAALVLVPAALPALIAFGQRALKLRGRAAETYNLALVPILPVAATILEDAVAGAIGRRAD